MLAPVLLLPKVVAIAERAGALVMEHYADGTTAVSTKADSSPVTA
jgi:3'(2'), 5'-bisphosphate nucleotidase